MQHFAQNSYPPSPLIIALPAWFRTIRDNFFNVFILALLVCLFLQKDITVRVQLHDRGMISASSILDGETDLSQSMNITEVLPDGKVATGAEYEKKDRRANNFSNLTFLLDPTYAERKRVPGAIVAEKTANCLAYVHRFANEARREMREHGIPASITLAQGLLESNAGDSRLARESNNHFGIKCRTKCRGCTCRNYTDDDIYDMFRVFEQPLQSYEEHSRLLSSRRYSHLLKLGRKNYSAWAHGLKKAGYATDKRYAEKLIRIIEALDLGRYDR